MTRCDPNFHVPIEGPIARLGVPSDDGRQLGAVEVSAGRMPIRVHKPRGRDHPLYVADLDRVSVNADGEVYAWGMAGDWLPDVFPDGERVGVAIDLDGLVTIGYRGPFDEAYTAEQAAAYVGSMGALADPVTAVMRGRIALVTLTDRPSWGAYLRRLE